jgi:hypothetical protein
MHACKFRQSGVASWMQRDAKIHVDANIKQNNRKYLEGRGYHF